MKRTAEKICLVSCLVFAIVTSIITIVFGGNFIKNGLALALAGIAVIMLKYFLMQRNMPLAIKILCALVAIGCIAVIYGIFFIFK